MSEFDDSSTLKKHPQNFKEPHPFTASSIRWIRSQPFAKEAPPKLLESLRELPADEQQHTLRDLYLYGGALAQTDKLRDAMLFFIGAGVLLAEFPEHGEPLKESQELARLSFARAVGDIDSLVELWAKYEHRVKADKAGLLNQFQEVRDIRDRLTPQIGVERARAISVLLQPVARSVVIGILDTEPWLFSEACHQILSQLLADASERTREAIEYALRLVDVQSDRTPDAEARRAAGQQRAAELVSLATSAFSADEPEGIFLAADRLNVSPLSVDDTEGLLEALWQRERVTVQDAVPAWLAWRAAQKARWHDSALAHFALEIMDLLRPVGGEYAVAQRRRDLGEFALGHAEAESPQRIAHLYYSLTHIFVRLSEFEGDKPELVAKQYFAGRQAVYQHLALGEIETAAQSMDLTLLAMKRLPEEQGGGLANTLNYIDGLLEPMSPDPASEPMPQLLRAALLTARYRLRESGPLDEKEYERSRLDLLEAFSIFSTDSGRHARQNAVRLCVFLSSLELKRAKYTRVEDLEEARNWSERGLALVDKKEDAEGFTLLAWGYVDVLRQQEDTASALPWIQDVLAIPGLASSFRAWLFLTRAMLRKEHGQPTAQDLHAGLQDIEEAQRLLGGSPNEEVRWLLIRTQLELHRELGQHREAAQATLRGLRAWAHILRPAHRAELRAELIPILQRQSDEREADEDEAAEQLDALLADAQALPAHSLNSVLHGVRDWLYTQCLRKNGLRYKPERDAALMSLSENAANGSLLSILLTVWRGRATGTSTVPELFAQIEKSLSGKAPPHEALLGLAYYLALRECSEDSQSVQTWGRRLEECLLMLPKDGGSTGSVDFLCMLANERLNIGPEPSLVHAQAAVRLLDKAEDVYPKERLSKGIRARLEKVRLRARVRLLGIQPGQDPHRLALEAQILERDLRALEAEDHLRLLDELHHWLFNYPAPDPAPIRAYTAQLRDNYGVGSFDTDRLDALNQTTKLSKKDRIRIQTLREEGVPKELVEDLLRGERLAQLSLLDASTANEGLALLMPLLSRTLAALETPWRASFTARVHRALGWLWTNHKSQDVRKVWTAAISHFQQASTLWPTSDAEGFLDVAHEHANALWRWESLDRTERQGYAEQARQVIRSALAHPRAADFPSKQAMLYRVLGLVEQNEEPIIGWGDEERLARALRCHEKALALCPDNETEERFQILVTLANACRDGFRAQRNSDVSQELLQRAIVHYREALSLLPALHAPPTEAARAKKCMADALVCGGKKEDLVEAKNLLLQSLQVRTVKRFPIPRAESLLSLAELELVCHEHGAADALENARRAAVECQEIVRYGGAPAVEQSVGAVLRRIGHLLGGKPVDATGRGEPGLPIPALWLKDRIAATSSPEIDPRISASASFEGNIASSKLFHDAFTDFSDSFRLADEVRGTESTQGTETLLAKMLERSEQAAASGRPDEARRYLWALIGTLHGNDFWPEEGKRLAALTHALLTEEYLNALPWERAVLWRHQAVHALQAGDTHLAETDWHWIELQARTAADVLASQASQDEYLPEFWKSLGLVLWKCPYGAVKNRHQEALIVFQKALTAARQHRQWTRVASLLNDLATLLHEMSRTEPSLRMQAIAHYGEIVALCQPNGQAEDLHLHQMALGNRGWARINQPPADQPQGFRDAVDDLEKALEICGDSPHLALYRAHHCNHLGLAHTDLEGYERGHFDQAIELFERSISLCQTLGNRIEEARAAHNLGLCLMRHGGPAELLQAKDQLKSALQRRRGRIIEEWETLGSLCDLRARMGWPFGALDDDAPLLLQVEALRDRLWKAELHERALMTHEYIFSLVSNQPQPDLAELIQRTEQALLDAESAWSGASRSAAQHSFSQQIATLAARRAFLAGLAGEPALDILRHSQRGKSRTLSWRRGIVLKELSPQLRNKHTRLLDELRRARASSRPEDKVAALQHEHEVLTLLRGESAVQATLPLDLDKLKACLSRRPQTAFLDLSLTPFGSVCVRAYLTRQGALVLECKRLDVSLHDVHAWLIGKSAADREGWLSVMQKVGDALMSKTMPDLEKLGVLEAGHAVCMRLLGEVHEKLLAPMTADLQAHGIVDLALCLPGLVGMLPLAATCRLRDDGTPIHLIERFQSLVHVPSLAAFIDARIEVKAIRRAAFVQTELGMPDSAEPMRLLVKKLRTTGIETRQLLEGGSGKERSSVNSALEAIDESDLVQFVCHGSFSPREPEASGLMLADGKFLSTERLLSHPFVAPARIVVLAACRSGQTVLDDIGGEWLGISGALLRSGVRDVIATLWDVETKSTLRLVSSFYRSLLQGETHHAVSLAAAMREQLSTGRTGEEGQPHPLTDHVADSLKPRLRRLCSSPLFWAGLALFQGG